MTNAEPKRGRGRPPFDPADVRGPLRVRLRNSQLDALHERVASLGINTTDAIEQAVADWLAKTG